MRTPFACSLAILFLSGCASLAPVKSQNYAKLPQNRTFEREFPAVWKAIEASLRNHRVVSRDPEDVGVLEMNQLERRQLETDWIYGRSRDKYVEYKVNGSPRKTYLQTRFRYVIDARKVLGGVEVKVRTDEEIERLTTAGKPDGYEAADKVDTSRGNELLDKIDRSILSAAP